VNPPRVLVRTLMIVVTLVAIDLTAIRAVLSEAMTFGVGLEALIHTVPMGLTLNYGLLRVLGSPRGTRAFWVGFLACGTAAMLSAAWGALTPAGVVHPASGAANQILGGSQIWGIWQSYFEFACNRLISLGLDVSSLAPSSLDRPGIGYITVTGLLALMPQLAIALLGGLIGRACVRKRSLALGGDSSAAAIVQKDRLTRHVENRAP
jgi:hypothetical protein